jgi:hypothetical protein
MWDSFKPKENVWYRWRLNGAEAYLRKNGENWDTAFKTIPLLERTADYGGPEEGCEPSNADIAHSWAEGESVSLHPYLSPKPYLPTVREKVRILPGMGTGFVANLPPLLKFELSPEAVLAESMPFMVPQTWFGADTMIGEFGHSLIGALRSHQESAEEKSSILIHCEIYVKNNAKIPFDMDHFAVYPEPLNVYLHNNQLISDSLELEFLGILEFTGAVEKVTVNEIECPDHQLLSPGIKTGVGQLIAKHSVNIIKNITRFY